MSASKTLRRQDAKNAKEPQKQKYAVCRHGPALIHFAFAFLGALGVLAAKNKRL